ncbi:MAG: Na+/Pi-cotransporter [Bacteroidetes bacterium ADurb.Bin408]|nr:MAG: Na+/Pi-cotransporter [Bacteroidetes bacterium ADurb.Bin408]
MSYSIFDFIKLMGSLAFFLFGMKMMSDNLQKLAGEKMRSVLGSMTKNRFFGIITGLFITTIIQSSSATTVMVVSFVNAALLNLTQAFSVIMGANIGTTVTAWIISLLGFKVNIAVIAIPLIGIVFPLLFFKKVQYHYLAEMLIGFSLLFMGLEYLKESVPDLRSNPEMFEFLQNFSGMGYGSFFIFIGVGTLLTIVLQSSSATMALTLVMCNNGWISFADGAAMVLGENIGTTITANLAALMGNTNAKRAALSHTIFNLIGVIWMAFFFNKFLFLIDKSLTAMGVNSPFTDAHSIPYALSIFHTSFNVTNTLLLVWFAKAIVKVPCMLIKESKKEKESKQTEYIGVGFMQVPELSLFQAKNLTVKYADIVRRMFGFVKELLNEEKEQERDKILERIVKYEEIIDKIEQEITEYLINVSNKEVGAQAKERIRRMRIMSIEIEKIGDTCHKMGILIRNAEKDKIKLSQTQRDKIEVMFNMVEEAFDIMFDNINNEKKENIEKAFDVENRINKYRDSIRDALYEEMEHDNTHFKSGFFANKICTSCEKIGDNIFNINEDMLGVNVE